MKDQEGDRLDEFFKEGLSTPPISEIDEDWERMKAILIKKNRKSVFVQYRVVIASMAAMMLLVLSVFLSKNKESVNKNVKAVKQIKSQVKPNETNPDQLTIDKGSAASPANNSSVNSSINSIGAIQKNQVALSNKLTSPYNVNGSFLIPKQNDAYLGSSESTTIEKDDKPVVNPVLAGNIVGLKPDSIKTVVDSATAVHKATEPVLAIVTEPTIKQDSSLSRKTEKKTPELFKPYFSLAFNVSPDVSGVNSVQNNKFGYSVGANIVYNLSSRIKVQTGVAYGSKVYHTNFSNYKPNSSYVFPVNPYEVDANCEVLDIPLNISYNLITGNRFNIGFGAGLSSYIMLKEKYAFDYNDITDRGPRRYSVANQNQHYLGVANFNVSYDRKLTNNISLFFSPYFKLPLTDIGYGNVRLRSTGISIGLITDLKKSKK